MATLQRKVFHSEEHDESNSDKVFDALCKIDKNSKATGKTSYVASNPAGEARKATAISGVFGEPTPWPSAEELAAGMKASLERLKQFGRRSATRKEQDLADNGEGSVKRLVKNVGWRRTRRQVMNQWWNVSWRKTGLRVLWSRLSHRMWMAMARLEEQKFSGSTGSGVDGLV